MCKTFRAWVDGISGDQAGVPWVGPQVVRQAIGNVGQVPQGCRVSRVVACDGQFQGVNTVDAASTSLWRCWARVDHHPAWGRVRIAAPPRFTWGIVKALG